MDSQAITRNLDRTLKRYQAGLISLTQARQELAFYQAMLKAVEQAEIEKKLEAIEAVLIQRR